MHNFINKYCCDNIKSKFLKFEPLKQVQKYKFKKFVDEKEVYLIDEDKQYAFMFSNEDNCLYEGGFTDYGWNGPQ